MIEIDDVEYVDHATMQMIRGSTFKTLGIKPSSPPPDNKQILRTPFNFPFTHCRHNLFRPVCRT